MILRGHFRDDFPRVRPALPARNGGTVAVEFLVDTGFNGDFKLPQDVVGLLALSAPSSRRVRLADGQERDVPYYSMVLEWEDPETEEANDFAKFWYRGRATR